MSANAVLYTYTNSHNIIKCLSEATDEIRDKLLADPDTPDDVRELLESKYGDTRDPELYYIREEDEDIAVYQDPTPVEQLLAAVYELFLNKIRNTEEKRIIPCKWCVHRHEIYDEKNRLVRCGCDKLFQKHYPNFFCAYGEYDESFESK